LGGEPFEPRLMGVKVGDVQDTHLVPGPPGLPTHHRQQQDCLAMARPQS
jgi:hypothetical protein